MTQSKALEREFDKRHLDIDDVNLYSASEESFQSLSSRRSASSIGQSDTASIDEEEEVKFLSFYEGLGWKQIVFIPHNTVWCYTLIGTILLHYFILVYGYHYKSDETKIIFYTPQGTILLIVIELMYFIDTTLSIIYKNWKSIYKVNVNPPRPLAHLICDVIALIPIEYIYWSLSGDTATKTRVGIYYCITSHSLIRIYRVFTFFANIRHNLRNQMILMRVLELIIYTSLLAHAASAIHFIFYCMDRDDECFKETAWSRLYEDAQIDNDFEWYLASIYNMIGICTFKSFALIEPDKLVKLLFFVVLMISFLMTYGFFIGQLMSAVIQDMYNTFTFSHRLKMIKRKLKELGVNKKTFFDIITYYKVLWQNRGGVHQNNLHYELFPNILYRDLNLDIFGDVFKRSHLLKTADESFLSFLSVKMKAEFFLPGDILYRKGRAKTKMIYLVTGIVQILTNEDDESPIISFSGGTCIGETALLMHSVCGVVVRCATYCEVQVLEKKDFHAVLKDYPELHHSFKISVQQRLRKSKELLEVGKKGLQPTDVVQLKDNSEDAVKWFKNFFQSILVLKNKRRPGTSVLEFNEINTDVHRTVAYMDLYVITEKLELINDDVCLRTTCPWILQPKSVVLDTWNNLIVATALFVVVLLPYFAFYSPVKPYLFYTAIYGVGILFIIDVLIQTCTAIKTKKELIAEWKQIFYLRLSEFGFIADILAAFPFELMVYMFNSYDDSKLNTVFMLNKLIKLWKVERFFREQEAHRLNMVYFIREIKHLFYVLVCIYIFGGIFYLQSCFQNDCARPGWYIYYHSELNPNVKKDAYQNFTISTFYSTMVIVGNSYLSVLPITILDTTLTAIAMLLSFAFIVYFFSVTAAMEILTSKSWSRYQDIYKRIILYMGEHHMDSNLQQRVLQYLDFCWVDDEASTLTQGRTAMYDLTPYLQERVYGPSLGTYLEKVSLLKDADPQFRFQLASASKTIVFQPNEVVCYSGEPSSSSYIIMNGYCQTVSNFTRNNAIEVIGPNSVFNLVEMCMQLPNVNTVRTITHCQMIQIEDSTMMSIIKKYPRSQTVLSTLVEACSEWKDVPELNAVNTNKNIFPNNILDEPKYSWYKFKNSPSDSVPRQEDKYKEPFTKLGYFSFVSLLLLRRTMVPDGYFIIGWEISRAVFAGISALLFPAAGALELITHSWVKYIRHFLDVTAIIDIYMRLHVAFFDYRGIVISHPLATSKNYLTHGFIIDLLGVFPFQIFAIKNGEDFTLFYFFLCNRVLQIHRMFGLFKYMKVHSTFVRNSQTLYNGIQYLIFGIILCNVTGAFLLMVRCAYTTNVPNPERFEKGIYCYNWNYVLKKHTFSEPLSPIRVHLYSVYFATSILTRCGLSGTMISDKNIALVVTGLSLLGLWMLKYIYARSIAIKSAHDVTTTSHQEKMKSLLQFIRNKKVSKELRDEVIKYFELIWDRQRAKGVYASFKFFPLVLKEDVLLQIYAKSLLECSVFASSNRAFLCQLILSCHVQIFVKGSTIVRPYEITTMIYFIKKGMVDLMAAGNVNVCAPLTVGCMFGNLPNALDYSHSLTVIARGHVEILAVPSSLFHKQIAAQPGIQKAFHVEVEKSHNDFYLSTKRDNEHNNVGSQESRKSLIGEPVEVSSKDPSSNTDFGELFVKMTSSKSVFLPDSSLVKVVHTIVMILSYLTFFIISYEAGYQESSLYFIGFVYAMDLVFLFWMYMQFKLAYYDEFGYLVTSPVIIASRYFRSKFGFVYDAVSILPIEVFSLFAPWGSRMYFFSMLQINRLLRSIYVIRWFVQQNRKLSINVFLMRYAFIGVWLSMLLHTLTWFYNLMLYIEKQNFSVFSDMTSLQRIGVYYTQLCVIISVFTGASLTAEELLPNTEPLILYCIILMIVTHIMVAFFIGEACAILETSNSTISRYTGRVNGLWKFYTMNDLSLTLREQLWSYLSLLWCMKDGQQVPYLLTRAPYYIREGIKNALYGEYVQTNAIFLACHDDFLRQLITCLKQYIFFPGNYITFAGDIDDNMYFVYSGEVEFLLPDATLDDEDVQGILVEGDAFGMTQGIYAKKEHLYNYRARTVAVLLILHRTDWENMLDSFPAVEKEISDKAAGFEYKLR